MRHMAYGRPAGSAAAAPPASYTAGGDPPTGAAPAHP